MGTNSHTIEELNEEVRRITEEKMKIQNENGKSIEEGEMEYVSQQEVAKEKIQKLEETLSLQQEQHLSSIETSKERLRSMDVELSEREKELNDLKRNEVEIRG